MATHSSVLAWRIPGTEEPGRLLSLGSHRVGHRRGDLMVTPEIVSQFHRRAGVAAALQIFDIQFDRLDRVVGF